MKSSTLITITTYAIAGIYCVSGDGSSQHIVDLSQDLVDDTSLTSSSPGARQFLEIASNDPLLRAAVVLEHGKVVAKYYREDPQVDPNKPNQVWSTTKSWTSLLIGLLVDDGKLSITETLGDVFPDETVWSDVTDGTVDVRKNVTVEEMLTMSSGLHTPPWQSVDKMLGLPEEDVPGTFEAMLNDGGETGGGTSLSQSLAYPDIGTKGDFHYLSTSNILSYVIKERSGLTPREYLEAKVMPALGIGEDEYNWKQNEDGVEFAFHGLEITALQMCKFGQIYLQGGQSKPPSDAGSSDHQLVSNGWVDASFQQHKVDPDLFKMPYGYLFWSVTNDMYCTIGVFGQDICINKATGRVVSQQRDRTPGDTMSGNLMFAELVADPTLSFAAGDEKQQNGTPPQLGSCSDGQLQQ